MSVQYRISFAARKESGKSLIYEKVLADNIIDINEVNRKYLMILKAFYKLKPEEVFLTPGSSYYVEIHEVSQRVTKKISFANVLYYS